MAERKKNISTKKEVEKTKKENTSSKGVEKKEKKKVQNAEKNEKKEKLKSVSKKKEITSDKEEVKLEIWKHVLVPKHEIATEEEVKRLYEEYNISFENLPKIYVYDPAIKHLNAKPGDVIKITRKSKIAGETIYYRGVIE